MPAIIFSNIKDKNNKTCCVSAEQLQSESVFQLKTTSVNLLILMWELTESCASHLNVQKIFSNFYIYKVLANVGYYAVNICWLCSKFWALKSFPLTLWFVLTGIEKVEQNAHSFHGVSKKCERTRAVWRVIGLQIRTEQSLIPWAQREVWTGQKHPSNLMALW